MLPRLENPWSYTLLGNFVLIDGVRFSAFSSLGQRGEGLQRASVAQKDMFHAALQRQPTDLNGHYVIPNFPCGGTAGKLNTFCQVSAQVIVMGPF